MQQINVDVHDAISLTLNIAIDGKTVLRKKADSFLVGYMNIMRSFMAGEPFEASANQVRPNVSFSDFFDAFKKADSIAVVSGKLQITDSSGHGMATGNVAYIMGVNGISGGNPNGWHAITSISGTVFELTNLTGLSGSHSEATSAAWYYQGIQSGTGSRSLDETLADPQIRCGTGTGANTTSTDSLEHEIPSRVSIGSGARTLNLTSATATVNTPSVGATDSVIEIIQAFTNSSGASITVEELGIWARYYDVSTTDKRYVMIVRDVLGGSAVTVNDTQTLTVTYEITTDVPTTSGGVLIQWNEMFYRQLAQTTREAKDIFNNNKVKGDENGQFYVNSHGGDNPLAMIPVDTDDNESYRIGPRVGTSTTNVVNTDFRLQDGAAANTAIEHGEATGEFYHYGAEVSGLKFSGTQISIEITRVFENRSGATISVEEVGLYVGYVSGAITGLPTIENVHCVSRHLVTTVSVLNNEFLKVTYTIAINV